jgi:hypothetical protein
VSVPESRSLSTIARTVIPRDQRCCVRHHKNMHLVGTIEPAHTSFLSAASRKLRRMCLLQLAPTDVRYWHKADIACLASMSAFGGKASIFGLKVNVCFWPKADIFNRIDLT